MGRGPSTLNPQLSTNLGRSVLSLGVLRWCHSQSHSVPFGSADWPSSISDLRFAICDLTPGSRPLKKLRERGQPEPAAGIFGRGNGALLRSHPPAPGEARSAGLRHGAEGRRKNGRGNCLLRTHEKLRILPPTIPAHPTKPALLFGPLPNAGLDGKAPAPRNQVVPPMRRASADQLQEVLLGQMPLHAHGQTHQGLRRVRPANAAQGCWRSVLLGRLSPPALEAGAPLGEFRRSLKSAVPTPGFGYRATNERRRQLCSPTAVVSLPPKRLSRQPLGQEVSA